MTQPSGIASSARLLLHAPGYVQGWQEPVIVANPAPGAGFAHTTPGQYSERLYAVTFRLTTSIVVANRVPVMQLTDNNGVRVTAGKAGGAVVASTVLRANLCITTPVDPGGIAGDTFGYLPDVLVPPGWTWTLNVGGIDAGDQVDLIMLLVQRFPSDITTISAVS